MRHDVFPVIAPPRSSTTPSLPPSLHSRLPLPLVIADLLLCQTISGTAPDQYNSHFQANLTGTGQSIMGIQRLLLDV